MSEWAKEMDTGELTTFMKEGYEKVLEKREEKVKDQEKKNKELEKVNSDKEPNKEIDVEQSMKLSNVERDAIIEHGSHIDFDDNFKNMNIDKDMTEKEPSDFQKKLKGYRF